MAVETSRLAEHHRRQLGSGGKSEIEIDQTMVLSHQAWPGHGDALGFVGPVAF